MAFTFVQTTARDADRLIPCIVCDSCMGPVEGEHAYVLFGPAMAQDTPVTSTEAYLVATVRVACSSACRDRELAASPAEDVRGYAPLRAYLTSLTKAPAAIRVTRMAR